MSDERALFELELRVKAALGSRPQRLLGFYVGCLRVVERLVSG